MMFRTCVAARFMCRSSLFLLQIGCKRLWCGMPWIRETDDGGQWLTKSLRSLGVIGIKLGQYLSQRPDLFADASRHQLACLTDRYPPVPLADLEVRLSVTGLSTVEVPALGTGSLAQVHRVQWQHEFAVAKVLLPGETIVLIELAVVRFVLDLLRCLGLVPVRWDAFLDDTERQLDLRNEATELNYAYTLFGAAEGLVMPNHTRVCIPYLHHSSPRCLVMEQAHGQSLSALTEQHRQKACVARIQALEHMTTSGDRRFHADLHDGNVMYDEKTDILWLLDFGLCAHPPPEWTSPPLDALVPRRLMTGRDHPSNESLSVLLSSLFSIDVTEALELVPLFVKMVVTSTPDGGFRESIQSFFEFTRCVKHCIGPHTLAYFMQLILIGYEM